MAFTKITNTELNSRGATTLPNQPTISAAALKQEFDAPAKEIVAPHLNGLIDELEADTAGASIGLQAPSRRTGSTVKAVVDAISQDLVAVEGKLNGVTNAGMLDAINLRHEHENKSLLDTYDQTNEDIEDAVNRKHSHSNKLILDKLSESAGGAPLYNGQPMSGDMYSSEYDPDSTVKNAGGIKSYVTTGLGTKVDKVEGKGLSTNDFTDALKTKLDNVEAGAEVNVQSDWNQSDNSADDYIKNKPSLGTSAYKNSTSVVTQSTDLVESGAVKDIVGWGNKNLLDPSIISASALKYVPFYVGSGQFTCSSDAPLNGSGGANLFLLAGNVSDGASTASNGVYINVSRTVESVDGYVTIVSRNTDGVDVRNYNNQLEVGATATAYEPYHASVSDSLEDKADNSVIAPVENGSTASQDYAVGQHFIRDRAFCKCIQAIASGGTLTEGTNYKVGSIGDTFSILVALGSITVTANSYNAITLPTVTGYTIVGVTAWASGSGATAYANTRIVGNASAPERVVVDNFDSNDATWNMYANITYQKN